MKNKLILVVLGLMLMTTIVGCSKQSSSEQVVNKPVIVERVEKVLKINFPQGDSTWMFSEKIPEKGNKSFYDVLVSNPTNSTQTYMEITIYYDESKDLKKVKYDVSPIRKVLDDFAPNENAKKKEIMAAVEDTVKSYIEKDEDKSSEFTINNYGKVEVKRDFSSSDLVKVKIRPFKTW